MPRSSLGLARAGQFCLRAAQAALTTRLRVGLTGCALSRKSSVATIDFEASSGLAS